MAEVTGEINLDVAKESSVQKIKQLINGSQVNIIGFTADYTSNNVYGKFVFDEPYDELPIVTAVDLQGSYRGENVLAFTKVSESSYNVMKNPNTVVATVLVELDGVTVTTVDASNSSGMARFGLTMMFSPRLT